MRLRRCFPVILGLIGLGLSVLGSREAQGQASPPSSAGDRANTASTAYLNYAPPSDQCVSREELAQAVRSHLGRDPFASEPSGVVINVQLEHVAMPNRWHARLIVGDGRSITWGDREVFSEGDDCRALDQPLTLILSLLIDSDLMQPPPAPGEDAPLPVRPLDPPESRFEEAPAPPPEKPSPPRPWKLELEVLGNLEHGVLPELALGGELGLFVRPAYFPDFRISAAAFVPQQTEVGSFASLRFLHARAGLQLCAPLAHLKPVQFDGCAGANAGLLHIEGEGLSPARSTTRSLFETTLALRGALSLTPVWSIVLMGQLLFPWQTDRFLYRHSNGQLATAHEISPFVFDIALGLALRFH